MKNLFVSRKFWIVVLPGIGVGLFCVIYRPLEPHYQGRSLSAWTRILHSTPCCQEPTVQEKAQAELAAEAIRQIGTNALPYALKLCSTHDSSLKRALLKIADDDEKLLGIQLVSADAAHQMGQEIFWVLGSTAKPAIPALIELFQNKDILLVYYNVTTDLAWIGPDVIAPLAEVLTNRNPQFRSYAIQALGELGYYQSSQASQVRPAVPLLVQCLNDKNVYLRCEAAKALGNFRHDAAEVVPALVAAYKAEASTNTQRGVPSLHVEIIQSLGQFRTNAQPAVPLLIEIIRTDQSDKLRVAFMALERIDPEMGISYWQKLQAAQTNPPPDDAISNLYYNYFGKGKSWGDTLPDSPSVRPAATNGSLK